MRPRTVATFALGAAAGVTACAAIGTGVLGVRSLLMPSGAIRPSMTVPAMSMAAAMLAGMTLPIPVGTGSPSSSAPASTEVIERV